MQLIRILAFLLIPALAHAAGPGYLYLVGTGATPCATINARNAQIAAALGNGPGTTAWFNVVTLAGGGCAVEIWPGTQFDKTISIGPSAANPQGITFSLTAPEIAALVARASLAGKLVDVLTLANFEALLTTAQINVLNSANTATNFPQVAADWAAIKAGAVVDMQDPQYKDLVARALAAGMITQTLATALTTPASVVQGP